jgi:hypothetical protein
MLKVCVFACAFAVAVTARTQSAAADGWPPRITGNWAVLGNFASGTLTISSQASSGQCQFIAGTVYGDAIQGFYCPGSGRIQFVRKINSNNDTVQVWTGNVSQDSTVVHMAGTFTSVDPNGGSPGEYSFHADK